ncbi:MAG: MiaB/RimO family radical SAM methylthiotransferase, partial [Lentisphaerae bacterium]|nr:MiaB/RimO family radical SAM methylthiotransferase [Lentisphaerota bacterium]
TCSVRGKAEVKALGKLRMAVARKRQKNPSLIVGAIGCMVQRLKEQIFNEVKGLDFAAGTGSFAEIPELIESLQTHKAPVSRFSIHTDADNALDKHQLGDISKFVTILLGCNRKCAYCIVPFVRGSEWSRAGKDIVKEVKQLVDNGVKEITLLGQSVMSYGKTNSVWEENHFSKRGYREPLPRLFEELDKIEGLLRIRFMSGHPSGCTEELARAMSEIPSVCEHMHLPVQSGSDRILKLMGRGYTTDDYRRAVELLRSKMPDISLTSDIILGFPSETLVDFEMTRSFVNEIRFDNLYIFKYSPRPNTRAAEWDDDIPEKEKLRRNHILLADQDKNGLAINKALVGSSLECLVEGRSLRDKLRWAAKTRTNKTVIFEIPETFTLTPGELVQLEITRAMPQTLYANYQIK